MKRIFYFAVTTLFILGTTTRSQAQGYIMLKSGDKQITITEQQVEAFFDNMEQKISDFAESIDANRIELSLGGNDSTIEIKMDKNDDVTISHQNSKNFRGSNRIISEERQVASNYEGVEASRAIKVVLSDRAGSTAIVRANDNLMPYINIKEKGGILHISIDDEIRTINNVTAEVNLPKSTNITSLKATSAAEIHTEYTIEAPELEIEANSAADIRIMKAEVSKCDIEISSASSVSAAIKATECSIEASSAAKASVQLLVNHCTAEASSAADIYLRGEAGSLDLEASSAADIKATDVNVMVATTAQASSGADIKVNVGKSLQAEASSGGTILYKSNKHDIDIHIKKSSGGSVRKM